MDVEIEAMAEEEEEDAVALLVEEEEDHLPVLAGLVVAVAMMPVLAHPISVSLYYILYVPLLLLLPTTLWENDCSVCINCFRALTLHLFILTLCPRRRFAVCR